MNKLRNWLFSIPFLIGFSIVLVGSDIVQRFITKDQKALFKIYHFVCNSVIKLLGICGVKFQIDIDEFVDVAQESELAKVVISNHQSLMDIAILNYIFPELNLRFISKKELSKNLPYVSFALRNLGHCLIDRDDHKQALQNIRDFVPILKQENCALAMFPEGTRARDGQMKKFKKGGIAAVVEELKEVMLFPVAISGSWKIAKHKLMPVPYGVKVHVAVLNPQKLKYSESLSEDLKQIEERILSNIDPYGKTS